MPKFIDPSGHTTFGIGICDRCSCKFPLDELFSDPNTPGLKVCKKDLDDYDPYRLPARNTENITLRFVRPDLFLTDFAASVGRTAGAWGAQVWAAGVWEDDTWEGIS